jgi:hypothetical protein
MWQQTVFTTLKQQPHKRCGVEKGTRSDGACRSLAMLSMLPPGSVERFSSADSEKWVCVEMPIAMDLLPAAASD